MRVTEWWLTCWLILAGAAAVGGCGAAAHRRTATLTLPAGVARLSPTAPLPPPPAGLPVGATERVHAGGAALAVTVAKVIDPLIDSGASLQPGTRAIGVLVRIVNRGPGIYDSSATGDFSVVPSTGPATPVFAPAGICHTPLQDFDNYITAGETRTGCVVFAVPSRARVEAVRFSPHAEAGGRLSWAVGP